MGVAYNEKASENRGQKSCFGYLLTVEMASSKLYQNSYIQAVVCIVVVCIKLSF